MSRLVSPRAASAATSASRRVCVCRGPGDRCDRRSPGMGLGARAERHCQVDDEPDGGEDRRGRHHVRCLHAASLQKIGLG